MLDLQLKAEPLLGDFEESFDGTTLSELSELAIVSMAIPSGGEAAFASALAETYDTDVPEPGGSTLSADGQTRFLWTARDQLFAVFEDSSPHAAADMAKKLDGAAYVTLQSDNWIALRLSGGRARDALERICPIDLHPSAFPEGQVARTIVEHMGTIVLREDAHSFLLFSASSMARSYLHAVETSLRNVT